jgi:hypothetical protein
MFYLLDKTMQLPIDGESCGIVYFYDTLRNGTAEVARNRQKLFNSRQPTQPEGRGLDHHPKEVKCPKN